MRLNQKMSLCKGIDSELGNNHVQTMDLGTANEIKEALFMLRLNAFYCMGWLSRNKIPR